MLRTFKNLGIGTIILFGITFGNSSWGQYLECGFDGSTKDGAKGPEPTGTTNVTPHISILS